MDINLSLLTLSRCKNVTTFLNLKWGEKRHFFGRSRALSTTINVWFKQLAFQLTFVSQYESLLIMICALLSIQGPWRTYNFLKEGRSSCMQERKPCDFCMNPMISWLFLFSFTYISCSRIRFWSHQMNVYLHFLLSLHYARWITLVIIRVTINGYSCVCVLDGVVVSVCMCVRGDICQPSWWD